MENNQPQIVRVFFLMVFVTLVYMEVCNNCPSGCDEGTDKCSGDCAEGWDGPSCSRRNVALNRPTWQTTTLDLYQSSLAVDGGTEHYLTKKPHTCTHTKRNNETAYWTVTLDALYNIYRFRIYNRFGNCLYGPCGNRLNGFTLSVRNSSQNYPDRVCYHDTTTKNAGPGNVTDGDCGTGGPILGNVVKIMINNKEPLTLCEVQIFVCANGTYGPDCGKRCGKCAVESSVCDTISGHCPRRTTRCLPGYSPPECSTECDDQLWGPDCAETCGNCYKGTVCNKTSGECPLILGNFRCAPGYVHTDKMCTTQCFPGRWGQNCKLTCSLNCVDGPTGCDVRNGACNGGCADGYGGTFCTPVNQNYTGVIIGCVAAVAVVAIVIFVIFQVRKRQGHNTGGTIDRSDDVNVGNQESCDQGRQATISALVENCAYENVSENEYDKIRFSHYAPEASYTVLG